jgi:hypothetical protein
MKKVCEAGLAVVFAAALMAFGTEAAAQASAPGSDEVVLTNGGRVRGTVMEQDPTRGVSIRLADGTTRQFAPAEVANVAYGAPPTPPPVAVAPPAPTVVVAPPAPLDPPLEMQVNSGQTALLQRRIGSFEGGATGVYTSVSIAGSDWQDLCTSPCNRPVPRNVMLRVRGDGMTTSGLFSIDDHVRGLRVEAGSSGVYWAGIWTAALGITAMITGASITLVWVINPQDFTGALIAGATTAGIGLLATIIGFPVASAAETHVNADTGRRLVRNSPPVRLVPFGVAF